MRKQKKESLDHQRKYRAKTNSIIPIPECHFVTTELSSYSKGACQGEARSG